MTISLSRRGSSGGGLETPTSPLPPIFVLSPETEVLPFGYDEMAWVADGDYMYLLGGFAYNPSGRTHNSDDWFSVGGVHIPIQQNTSGDVGAVMRWNMLTGEVIVLNTLPIVEAATWVYDSDIEDYVVGPYCVEGCAAVKIDNILYMAGGDSNRSSTTAYNSFDTYSIADPADPNHANDGGRIADAPLFLFAVDLDDEAFAISRKADKPCGTDYCAAVSVGRKGYWIGGYTNNNSYPFADVYDVDTDTWDRTPIAQGPMAESAVVAVGTDIYVFTPKNSGGFWTGSDPDVISDPASWETAPFDEPSGGGTMFKYDTVALTWTSLAFAPDDAQSCSSVSLIDQGDNKLWLVGHAISPYPVYEYDIDTDSWSVIDLTLDQRRVYCAAAKASDGKVHIMGESDPNVGGETPAVESGPRSEVKKFGSLTYWDGGDWVYGAAKATDDPPTFTGAWMPALTNEGLNWVAESAFVIAGNELTEVQAGTDIGVDNTDPQRPIVSFTGSITPPSGMDILLLVHDNSSPQVLTDNIPAGVSWVSAGTFGAGIEFGDDPYWMIELPGSKWFEIDWACSVQMDSGMPDEGNIAIGLNHGSLTVPGNLLATAELRPAPWLGPSWMMARFHAFIASAFGGAGIYMTVRVAGGSYTNAVISGQELEIRTLSDYVA